MILNGSANKNEVNSFLKAGLTARELLPNLEATSDPVSSSANTQTLFGGIALAVGGVGIAGSITLFILNRKKQKKKILPLTTPNSRASSLLSFTVR